MRHEILTVKKGHDQVVKVCCENWCYYLRDTLIDECRICDYKF